MSHQVKPLPANAPFSAEGITLPFMRLSTFARLVDGSSPNPFDNCDDHDEYDVRGGWIVRRSRRLDRASISIHKIIPLPADLVVERFNVRLNGVSLRGLFIGTRDVMDRLGEIEEQVNALEEKLLDVIGTLPNTGYQFAGGEGEEVPACEYRSDV
ncbi:hypothetical protein K2Y11_22510 [bacterium]|nr:hypothetical protein [bacterium]